MSTTSNSTVSTKGTHSSLDEGLEKKRMIGRRRRRQPFGAVDRNVFRHPDLGPPMAGNSGPSVLSDSPYDFSRIPSFEEAEKETPLINNLESQNPRKKKRKNDVSKQEEHRQRHQNHETKQQGIYQEDDKSMTSKTTTLSKEKTATQQQTNPAKSYPVHTSNPATAQEDVSSKTSMTVSIYEENQRTCNDRKSQPSSKSVWTQDKQPVQRDTTEKTNATSRQQINTTADPGKRKAKVPLSQPVVLSEKEKPCDKSALEMPQYFRTDLQMKEEEMIVQKCGPAKGISSTTSSHAEKFGSISNPRAPIQPVCDDSTTQGEQKPKKRQKIQSPRPRNLSRHNKRTSRKRNVCLPPLETITEESPTRDALELTNSHEDKLRMIKGQGKLALSEECVELQLGHIGLQAPQATRKDGPDYDTILQNEQSNNPLSNFVASRETNETPRSQHRKDILGSSEQCVPSHDIEQDHFNETLPEQCPGSPLSVETDRSKILLQQKHKKETTNQACKSNRLQDDRDSKLLDRENSELSGKAMDEKQFHEQEHPTQNIFHGKGGESANISSAHAGKRGEVDNIFKAQICQQDFYASPLVQTPLSNKSMIQENYTTISAQARQQSVSQKDSTNISNHNTRQPPLREERESIVEGRSDAFFSGGPFKFEKEMHALHSVQTIGKEEGKSLSKLPELCNFSIKEVRGLEIESDQDARSTAKSRSESKNDFASSQSYNIIRGSVEGQDSEHSTNRANRSDGTQICQGDDENKDNAGSDSDMEICSDDDDLLNFSEDDTTASSQKTNKSIIIEECDEKKSLKEWDEKLLETARRMPDLDDEQSKIIDEAKTNIKTDPKSIFTPRSSNENVGNMLMLGNPLRPNLLPLSIPLQLRIGRGRCVSTSQGHVSTPCLRTCLPASETSVRSASNYCSPLKKEQAKQKYESPFALQRDKPSFYSEEKRKQTKVADGLAGAKEVLPHEDQLMINKFDKSKRKTQKRKCDVTGVAKLAKHPSSSSEESRDGIDADVRNMDGYISNEANSTRIELNPETGALNNDLSSKILDSEWTRKTQGLSAKNGLEVLADTMIESSQILLNNDHDESEVNEKTSNDTGNMKNGTDRSPLAESNGLCDNLEPHHLHLDVTKTKLDSNRPEKKNDFELGGKDTAVVENSITDEQKPVRVTMEEKKVPANRNIGNDYLQLNANLWRPTKPIPHTPLHPSRDSSKKRWTLKLAGFSENNLEFQLSDGNKYIHPPLPPGWSVKVEEGKLFPVYCHIDGRQTDYAPILLPPYDYSQNSDTTPGKAKLWTSQLASNANSISLEFTLREGKKYRHPPLPSGWMISVCMSRNVPFYGHLDFGWTRYPPVVLPDEEEDQIWTAKLAGFPKPEPFTFRLLDGTEYLHPPLPPGWSVKVSEKENKPIYDHPDFGQTIYSPVVLFESEQEPPLKMWTAALAKNQKSSPVFRLKDGKKYKHSRLPPGWSIHVSWHENIPYYSHHLFGCTRYSPVRLPETDSDENDEELFEGNLVVCGRLDSPDRFSFNTLRNDRLTPPGSPSYTCDDASDANLWTAKQAGNQDSAPVFCLGDGVSYTHTPLPPGWRIRVGNEDAPFYYHPDFGKCHDSPVPLPVTEDDFKKRDQTTLNAGSCSMSSVEDNSTLHWQPRYRRTPPGTPSPITNDRKIKKIWTAALAGNQKDFPVFRLNDGTAFRHPRLPPGWSVEVSKYENIPYYCHPCFGKTRYSPVLLPETDDGWGANYIPSTSIFEARTPSSCPALGASSHGAESLRFNDPESVDDFAPEKEEISAKSPVKREEMNKNADHCERKISGMAETTEKVVDRSEFSMESRTGNARTVITAADPSFFGSNVEEEKGDDSRSTPPHQNLCPGKLLGKEDDVASDVPIIVLNSEVNRQPEKSDFSLRGLSGQQSAKSSGNSIVLDHVPMKSISSTGTSAMLREADHVKQVIPTSPLSSDLNEALRCSLVLCTGQEQNEDTHRKIKDTHHILLSSTCTKARIENQSSGRNGHDAEALVRDKSHLITQDLALNQVVLEEDPQPAAGTEDNEPLIDSSSPFDGKNPSIQTTTERLEVSDSFRIGKKTHSTTNSQFFDDHTDSEKVDPRVPSDRLTAIKGKNIVVKRGEFTSTYLDSKMSICHEDIIDEGVADSQLDSHHIISKSSKFKRSICEDRARNLTVPFCSLQHLEDFPYADKIHVVTARRKKRLVKHGKKGGRNHRHVSCLGNI